MTGPPGRWFATPAPTAVGAHLYQTRFAQADYHQYSPYSINYNYYDIFGVTIKNNTSQPITEFAVSLPGPYAANNTLEYVAIDQKSSGSWTVSAPCGNANLSAAWVCFTGSGGANVPANGTTTVYFDETTTPTSFGYTDMMVQALKPQAFFITPDSTNVTVPVGPSNPYTVDKLGICAILADRRRHADVVLSEHRRRGHVSDPEPEHDQHLAVGGSVSRLRRRDRRGRANVAYRER